MHAGSALTVVAAVGKEYIAAFAVKSALRVCFITVLRFFCGHRDFSSMSAMRRQAKPSP